MRSTNQRFGSATNVLCPWGPGTIWGRSPFSSVAKCSSVFGYAVWANTVSRRRNSSQPSWPSTGRIPTESRASAFGTAPARVRRSVWTTRWCILPVTFLPASNAHARSICHPDRVAVQSGGRAYRLLVNFLPYRLPERCANPFRRAVITPAPVLLPYRARGRDVVRERLPRAGALRTLEDCVSLLAQKLHAEPARPPSFGWWHRLSHDLRLPITRARRKSHVPHARYYSVATSSSRSNLVCRGRG